MYMYTASIAFVAFVYITHIYSNRKREESMEEIKVLSQKNIAFQERRRTTMLTAIMHSMLRVSICG